MCFSVMLRVGTMMVQGVGFLEFRVIRQTSSIVRQLTFPRTFDLQLGLEVNILGRTPFESNLRSPEKNQFP